MTERNMKTFPSINENYEQNQREFCDYTIHETLAANKDESKRTLQTFTGVFCPVALAQFSSLLFLRLGFVLGQTGLLLAILQLIMAYVILLLTILSICAISTNGAIKGGGVYFMISRTLGPEVGGSIGILFFLANVFSSALFMAAFVEGLIDNFGPAGRVELGIIKDGFGWEYLFETCVCLFCLGVCIIGGAMFAKTNLVIFLIVFVCFLSVIVTFLFQNPIQVKIPRINKIIYTHLNMSDQMANYTGLSGTTFKQNLYYGSYEKDFTTMKQMSFFAVFAILFPGVTGIMNGANMSGELKQPAVAIPRGTLAATLFTFICYILSFFLSAATCDRHLLLNNYLYMQAISLCRPLVIVGMFLTCISAGLGNFIGASRILYALAKDDIFGVLLKPAKYATKGGNPIASVVISFVLVQVVLFIGKVNLISPVVSVFFLLAYASVNFACGLLDWASASNFRPTFKYFSWITSMVGVVCCLAMCFLASYQYSIGIFLLFIVIIVVLSMRNLEYSWGKISQALLFHQVRKYLLMIDIRKEHVKYWRPQVLLLLSNPRSQASLVQFVNILKKGGLFVIGHVIKADFEKIDKDPAYEMQKKFITMKDFLKIKAFIDVTIAQTIRDGCRQLVRLCGLGGLSINTVCIGFRDDSKPQDVLKRIHLQMSYVNRNWPLKPKYVPSFNEIREDATSTDTHQKVAINLENQNSFVGSLNENTRLINKKRIKLFDNILKPSVDPKFIDELPQIRTSKQPVYSYVNKYSEHRDNDDDDAADVESVAKEGDEFSQYDQLSEMEYVGIIADCMKLQKNICLCRHFDKMDLMDLTMKNSSEYQYIDVWPINFFQPGSGSYLDKTCMFMLQLSCILNMSSQWSSKCKIRVFTYLDHEASSTSTKNIQELWNELLIQWRIQAEVKTIVLENITTYLDMSTSSVSSYPIIIPTKSISSFDFNLPNDYILEINKLIKMNTSSNTSVCFLYLPMLPNISQSQYWKKYIQQLTILSNDLPPSVFVRGEHEVITAAL